MCSTHVGVESSIKFSARHSLARSTHGSCHSHFYWLKSPEPHWSHVDTHTNTEPGAHHANALRILMTAARAWIKSPSKSSTSKTLGSVACPMRALVCSRVCIAFCIMRWRDRDWTPQISSLGIASTSSEIVAAKAALAASSEGISLRTALAGDKSASLTEDRKYLSRASELFAAFAQSDTTARSPSAKTEIVLIPYSKWP